MKRYIALLRGINVGGHKKILMADLRTLLSSAGLSDVKTYIQSGNVVFTSPDDRNLDKIISEAIKTKYGFKVPILIKKASELTKIIENCPISAEKRENSYFILLKSEPTSRDVNATQEFSTKDEEFYIHQDCVYIVYNQGAGKAKMGINFFEKKLNVEATARNYRTMLKLIELAGTD